MPSSPESVRTVSTLCTRFAIALGLVAASCAQPTADSSVSSTTAAVTAASTGASPSKLDVLFMIDNSSSMTFMQQKLAAQIPSFLTELQALPTGLPDLHIAVVSSDMGAPGDSTTSIGCTQVGDQGVFRTGTVSGGGPAAQHPGLDAGAPGGAAGGDDAGSSGCAGASLNSDATFIADGDGVTNYTGDLSTLLSCMTTLGDNGCGFEHQLASISRALGADGAPAPAANAGFLRPDAQLAIIVLSNEDDCSAPPNTLLYSLDGFKQNISNPLGPIANYRCNEYGHLCVDSASATPTCAAAPPLTPPADAQGTAGAPTLTLTNCESDDSPSSLLSSVADFANGIKALKADPENQIVVGAIVAPPAPYTVAWVPPAGGQPTTSGELWPEVEHSCGPVGGYNVEPTAQAAADGTFGDPAVRLSQWVKAFGANGVTASICDGSYSDAFGTIVSKIGAQMQGGGTSADAGATEASPAICPNGLPSVTGTANDSNPDSPTSGLHKGGCDISATRPTAASLGLLLLFLIPLLTIARRRRPATRRSARR